MEQKFGDKLSSLDLTNEEITRLTECMKDERFVELLRDYADEISNPENKRKYEEEIAMLEMERGNDVKFIHPSPGHVLKTSKNGEEKCFINICSSSQVGKPVNKPTVKDSTRGMQWSIPHSLSQPREDKDKAGGKCTVYDVVFNPDTYHMAEKNARFRKMIHDMALDAVERLFNVTLDKINVKKPKMKFKGLPQASIIRTPREDTRELNARLEKDPDDPLKFPYPPMSNGPTPNESNVAGKRRQQEQKNLKDEDDKGKFGRDIKPTGDMKSDLLTMMESIEQKEQDFVEPKYTLTHRGYFDMKEYYNMPDQSVVSTRPRELIVNIELPMLKAASALHLEIFEERVSLECAKPVKYKLDLKLPYPVDDSKGHARFDKSKRKLAITLEVLPPILPELQTSTTQEEKDDACGSCAGDEELIQTGQDVQATTAEEEDPAENELLPSDHSSGLVHGRSKCRHQNHGALWGAGFEENSETDSQFHYLYNTSPLLVEMLAGCSSAKATPGVLCKVCPRIFYHQDERFVTIIVNLKCIDSERLWYVLSKDNLQFSACDDARRKLPAVYQLYMQFGQTQVIDPRRSRVDVSDDNAVFLLRKHISSEFEWQTFEAGFDRSNLKTFSFATENNINELISAVNTEARKSVTREFDCEDVSDKQNPELLALKLTPKEVVDEERISDVRNEQPQMPDELPIMSKVLAVVCDAKERRGVEAKIDHEKILLSVLNSDETPEKTEEDPETDEDDDSEKYETADSSEDEESAREMENKTLAGKAMEEKPQEGVKEGSSMQDLSKNSVNGEKKVVESGSSKENVKVCQNGQSATCRNQNQPRFHSETLLVQECKNGPKEIIQNHKTKSVITLNNEMLFEIDSD